ncbi:uncharacterized protein LOC116599065 [Mustela erminea]|uniref:uncharacterized protein LOC116599065 n=1 Tax=Mustela erminea TaxID=36723 RepID=UPI001386659B|nr:uncharacterized protein LOC116599065 [Mustela erminea]
MSLPAQVQPGAPVVFSCPLFPAVTCGCPSQDGPLQGARVCGERLLRSRQAFRGGTLGLLGHHVQGHWHLPVDGADLEPWSGWHCWVPPPTTVRLLLCTWRGEGACDAVRGLGGTLSTHGGPPLPSIALRRTAVPLPKPCSAPSLQPVQPRGVVVQSARTLSLTFWGCPRECIQAFSWAWGLPVPLGGRAFPTWCPGCPGCPRFSCVFCASALEPAIPPRSLVPFQSPAEERTRAEERLCKPGFKSAKELWPAQPSPLLRGPVSPHGFSGAGASWRCLVFRRACVGSCRGECPGHCRVPGGCGGASRPRRLCRCRCRFSTWVLLPAFGRRPAPPQPALCPLRSSWVTL